jgi:D-alanyl-D-alanine carboxypeptidase/D-alanyl-D-alanine-endopeptidase (penicillin-binding protein 4)
MMGVSAAHHAVAQSPRSPAPSARDARRVTDHDVRRVVDSIVTNAAWQRAQWGVLILDAVTGDTIVAHQPRSLLVPASNQKIITAAVALTELGPEFRFTTTLATTAPVRDGVLEGDLIVLGTGDPSITDRIRTDARAVLHALVDSLMAHGITRVRGALRMGPAVFTDPPLGAGWEWDDLGAGYAASVGDLMYNDAYAPTLVLVGSDSLNRGRTAAHPAFVSAFADVLWRRGLLDSGAVATSRLAFVPVDTLVRFASPPLRELLPHFLKPSQNQSGEIYLKTLGRVVAGAGRADSGRAVITRRLTAWGVADGAVLLSDGSGLSRHNFVSAEALAQVLQTMARDSLATLFRESFPLAGVDGTLERRLRGGAATGRLWAKTGSLNRVRALSGYALTADGRSLIVVLLVNNFVGTAATADAALDRIAATITAAQRDR